MSEPKSPSDHTDEPLASDLAVLSRAYKQGQQDQPPPALDDAIRAAARRAVHARPQPLRKSWVQRWTGPVATAAVIVLTVSIGFLSMEERPEFAPPPMQKVMKPRTALPADLQADMSNEAAQSHAPQPKAKDDRSEPAPEKHVAPSSPPTMGNLAVAPRAPRKRVEAPVTASEPAPFAANRSVAQESSKLQESHKLEAKVAPAPVPAEEAPATASASRVKSKADNAATLADTAGAPSQRSPQAAAAPFAESRALLRQEAETESTAKLESPNAWLKRILSLRKEGKAKEAEEELAKFKRRYPDYPLPDELKGDRSLRSPD